MFRSLHSKRRTTHVEDIYLTILYLFCLRSHLSGILVYVYIYSGYYYELLDVKYTNVWILLLRFQRHFGIALIYEYNNIYLLTGTG